MDTPKRPLRIALADEDPATRHGLCDLLTVLGHQVLAQAANGRQLVQLCQAAHPDLVVTGIHLPILDGLEALAEVNRQRPTPAVVISGSHDPGLLERARAVPVLAYLSKPVKPEELAAAVELSAARFEQMEGLRREADALRLALEERKAVEHAKGVVMKRCGLDEPAAFRQVQKFASERNLKLADAAREVIRAEEVFGHLDAAENRPARTGPPVHRRFGSPAGKPIGSPVPRPAPSGIAPTPGAMEPVADG